MLIYPMPNNDLFGERIRQLRTEVLNASQDRIAAAGGPSGPQQSRVESGAMTVSSEWLTRYGTAAHELEPNKFSVQAGSYFHALAAAYNAATDGLDRKRATAIAEAADRADHGVAVFGINLATDELVLGHSLKPAREIAGTSIQAEGPPPLTDSYMAATATTGAASTDEFLPTAYRIAGRYRGISLFSEDSQYLHGATVCWLANRSGTIQYSAARRFDPIADTTTLRTALHLAGGLAYDTTNNEPQQVSTAWIILLANAISGKHGDLRPIDVYAQHRNNPEPWAHELDHIDQRARKDLPDIQTMLNQAAKYLKPWVHEGNRLEDWDIRFTPNDAGGIQWTVDIPDEETPLTAQHGDLWLIPSETQKTRTIENILSVRGTQSISIRTPTTSTTGPGDTWALPWLTVNNPTGQYTNYDWAPAGLPSHPYGLLRQPNGTWQAAQLF